MRPHPVFVAADGDDVAVVEQSLDERRRHHLVAERAAPFLEALVRLSASRRMSAGVDRRRNGRPRLPPQGTAAPRPCRPCQGRVAEAIEGVSHEAVGLLPIPGLEIQGLAALDEGPKLLDGA